MNEPNEQYKGNPERLLGDDAEVIVEQTKSFYQENKDGIQAILVIGLILVINKRMVRTVVRKELANMTFVFETFAEGLEAAAK